jgi:hypothetical protein
MSGVVGDLAVIEESIILFNDAIVIFVENIWTIALRTPIVTNRIAIFEIIAVFWGNTTQFAIYAFSLCGWTELIAVGRIEILLLCYAETT